MERKYPQRAQTPSFGMSVKDQIKKGFFTKILVVYTGGTIGMKSTKTEGYIPNPEKGFLLKVLQKISQFSKFCDPETNFNITPRTPARGKKGAYHVLEYTTLLDSSCMDYKDWNKIGKTIKENYNDYDSFIILHGTDTMAYTASALSYQLENLNKLVIVTGSQIPLSEIRNDGYSNLLGAFILAIDYANIPEVCVYFDNQLFRGNRTSKNDSSALNAFDSPNALPLANLGIDISVHWDRIQPNPSSNEKFKLFEMTYQNVEIVYFYPGLSSKILRSVLLNGETKAVILLTYGAGNINSKNKEYLKNN